MNFAFPTTFPGHLVLSSILVTAAGFMLHYLLRFRSAAWQEMAWRSVFLLLLMLPAAWALRPFGMVPQDVPGRKAPVGVTLAHEDPPIPALSSFSPAAPTPFPWDKLILGSWTAGFSLLLLRLASVAYWRRCWKAEAVPCEDHQVLALWKSIDPQRNGRLLMSTVCPVPLTWGRVVMLPVTAVEWPTDDLTAALRHEAAHLERRDSLYRILGEVATAIFWLNPLVWMARRLWHRSQEQSCDDAVLRSGHDPANYAGLLCAAAREWVRPTPAGGLCLSQPSSLECRLKAVLNPALPRNPCGAGAQIASGVTILLLFIGSALAQKQSLLPTDAAGTAPVEVEKSASETQIKKLEEDLKNLEKILSTPGESPILLEQCLKLNITEDATIQAFTIKYKNDSAEYPKLRTSGFGKRNPRVIELKKQIEEDQKILMTAFQAYRAKLPVMIRNLRTNVKK